MASNLYGQEQVVIEDIQIIGLQKTKRYIVIRELEIGIGDTIDIEDTSAVFARQRDNIFNTTLFNEVKVYVSPSQNEKGKVTLQVAVKERWYVFPVPILELADRNFNEWWQQRNKDFSRLEYGLRLYHYNFRGRNEKIKLVLQQGFTPKYELFYTFPYINKKLKTGVKFSFSYSENKQVGYTLEDHQLTYFKGEKVNRKRFYTGVTFLRRENLYTNHELSFIFRDNTISDSILQVAPSYFLTGNTKLQFLELKYTWKYDKRDIKYFPLKGGKVEGFVEKIGVGIWDDVNQFTIGADAQYLYSIHKKWYAGHSIKGELSTLKQQPFFLNHALGYQQNFVRGYELSVINGQHYVLQKSAIKYLALDKTIRIKKIPFSQFNEIPIKVMFNLFVDYGYVKSNDVLPTTTLVNKNLLGYGVGMDIATYYDLVMRVELSRTIENKGGIFVHFKSSF